MTTQNVSCLRHSILSLAALCGLGAFTAATAAEQSSIRVDKEAIAALIYCYAQGTDAIGDSTTHADPLAAGAAIYRRCFADNAELLARGQDASFQNKIHLAMAAKGFGDSKDVDEPAD